MGGRIGGKGRERRIAPPFPDVRPHGCDDGGRFFAALRMTERELRMTGRALRMTG